MICKSCGKVCGDDARFCTNCGLKLEKQEASVAESQKESTEDMSYLSNDDSRDETEDLELSQSVINLSDEKRDTSLLDAGEVSVEEKTETDGQSLETDENAPETAPVEETGLSGNAGEPEAVSNDKEDEYTPDNTASEIQADTLEEKGGAKPLNPFIMGFAGLLITALLALSAFLLFSGSGQLKYEISPLQESPTEADVLPEKILIPDTEIVLAPGGSKQISLELYPQNAVLTQPVWSWDTGDRGSIYVSEDGRVTGNEPGYEGVVTVSSGNAAASVKVRVMTEEEAFFETISWINNKSQNEVIDLFENNYKPNVMSDTLKELPKSEQRREWGVNIFTAVNNEISTYEAVQKQLVNKDTGNRLDVDVYRHTGGGAIRKIVTIEYKDSFIEVTDYYFSPEGKIAFVFNRNENYYRPVPANWGIPGIRLYFADDAMTTWRDTVNNAGNYSKTDYSLGVGGIEWDISTYNFSDGDILNETVYGTTTGQSEQERLDKLSEYEELELKYINAAYNLYNLVMEIPDTFTISGYAIAADLSPLSGVSVKVFSDQYNMLVSQSVTNSDGAYAVTVPRTRLPYTVYLTMDGYIPTRIYDVESGDSAANNFLPVVYMLRQAGSGTMTVLLSLTDALTGLESDLYTIGAQLRLRPGINNKTGSVARTIRLMPYETEGVYTGYYDYAYYNPLYNAYIIAVEPGNYTAELVQDGLSGMFFTLSTVRENYTVRSNIVPVITGDEMKIVLSWEDTPPDLDSHLFYPNGDHISYYSRTVGGDNLDVDCTSGYGPETVTIKSVGNGTYKYYVADFSNCANGSYQSYQMSNSFANVSVYTRDGLIRTFNVPRNQSGVIWHVFDITNGAVVPVERYYNNVQDMQWWSSQKPE